MIGKSEIRRRADLCYSRFMQYPVIGNLDDPVRKSAMQQSYERSISMQTSEFAPIDLNDPEVIAELSEFDLSQTAPRTIDPVQSELMSRYMAMIEQRNAAHQR